MISRDLESLPTTNLFWTLVIAFGIFYLVQIPFMTSNSDVIIYSLRSKSHAPIIGFAFLENCVCSDGTPLPNYHIAHTLILWLVYQPMPEFLKNSIWPAGLVSAISAAFSVGIVFLIWWQLGISKSKSLLASVVYGIVPTVWHHALIGEVYSLQFLFVYLFLYQFLRGRILLSALSFAMANLVSPLSGLCFSLLLVGEKNKKQFANAILVGFLATAFYLVVVSIFKIDVFKAFDAIDSSQRSLLWRLQEFVVIIMLNVNLAIIFMYYGIIKPYDNKPQFGLFLFLSTTPFIILSLCDSQFLDEKGSFLSIIHWACSYFIANGIARFSDKKKHVLVYFLANIVVYFAFWNMSGVEHSLARKNAAFYLQKNSSNQMKIFGNWSHSVDIIVTRDGWDLDNLTDKYFDLATPTEKDLIQTGEDSLLLVHLSRDNMAARLSKLIFPGSKLNMYDPRDEILHGTIEEVYRNDFFVVYLWRNNYQ